MRRSVALFWILCTSATSQPATHNLIFRNVDVFDGFRMLRNQSVAVTDGMIATTPSANAESVDGTGKTLLPGLIDAHIHIAQVQSLEQAAALGVTTNLDMYAGYMQNLMKLRTELKAGQHPNAADFRTAGVGITAPKGHPTELMPDLKLPTLGPHDDPQAFVDARIAEGSDYIKIMYEHQLPTFTKEQLAAIVRAAHRRGKLAVSHISTQAEAYDAIAAGVDGLAHIFDDTPPKPDFATFAASRHIFVIGTLSVLQAFAGAPSGSELANDPRLGPYLFGPSWQIIHVHLPKQVSRGHRFEYAQAAMRQLHAAGVPLLAGTDAPNPDTGWGISLHHEMELLTGCGLTTLEALHAATAGPAREFSLLDRGRIEPGRRADLLLVSGDPSKDIRATRAIVGVWKAGVRINRDQVRLDAEKSRH